MGLADAGADPRLFWVSYAIVLGFQLLTNGVLAGLDIVVYDDDAILGWRLVFAPVEDLLFGFALVVQTLAWWTFWGRRGVQREPIAGPPRWWPGGIREESGATGAHGVEPRGQRNREPA